MTCTRKLPRKSSDWLASTTGVGRVPSMRLAPARGIFGQSHWPPAAKMAAERAGHANQRRAGDASARPLARASRDGRRGGRACKVDARGSRERNPIGRRGAKMAPSGPGMQSRRERKRAREIPLAVEWARWPPRGPGMQMVLARKFLAKSHWPAAAILGRACKADARGSGREKSHWQAVGEVRGENRPLVRLPGGGLFSGSL